MPLSFEIYRDGQRLNSFQPIGAFAVGPESVPIPGDVTFRDGLLTVRRSDDVPLGLSLLWDAGDVGCYHLETTRLAVREQPYNLNVELARSRLMRILQKLEDWGFFDFPRADVYSQRLRDAQDMLAEALGLLGEPAKAAALADRALSEGISLSEELALFHCDLLLNRRKLAGSFVKHIFGCRVEVTVQNQKYRDLVAGQFDYAVMPTPWRQIEPQEGALQTELVDTWAETLARKRVPIIAGPLVNFDEAELPDWMFIWENDFDTVREMAFEHVQRMATRYRKAVSLWNVCSGLCTNRAFTLTFEQMIEMTRLLVAQVKNIIPNARTLVSVPMPFGEYHAKNPTSVAPQLYSEMVAQAGINFDGFAIELEMGLPLPGYWVRDLFQISTLLDRFSSLGRPLFITAISAPGRNTPDPADRSEGRLDPAAAGRWHRPWDPQLQADWMEAVYHIAVSKPFVESVAWGNVADIEQSVPGGGLVDDMFQPKPAMQRLLQMRDKFAQWAPRK